MSTQGALLSLTQDGVALSRSGERSTPSSGLSDEGGGTPVRAVSLPTTTPSRSRAGRRSCADRRTRCPRPRPRTDQRGGGWRANAAREAIFQRARAREVEIEPRFGGGHERQQAAAGRRLSRSHLVAAHDSGRERTRGDPGDGQHDGSIVTCHRRPQAHPRHASGEARERITADSSAAAVARLRRPINAGRPTAAAASRRTPRSRRAPRCSCARGRWSARSLRARVRRPARHRAGRRAS